MGKEMINMKIGMVINNGDVKKIVAKYFHLDEKSMYKFDMDKENIMFHYDDDNDELPRNG